MSVATAINAPITPEDLLALEDSERYELLNGRLMEQSVSLKSSWVAGQIFRLIARFLDEHPIGDLFPEGTSYQCFPEEPRRVRRADVSFIRTGRLTESQFDSGHCPIAPDLAVEVVSPHDNYADVVAKLDDYFSAGVPLVWVVEPESRTVAVYRNGAESISLLHEADELSGEQVIHGFVCRVADIFPKESPKPPVAPPA